MKIAITTPTTWPYVRRGAERLANETARYLAGQGHDVTIISGKPGPKEIIPGDGYVTICHRRLWHPSWARFGLLEFHMFFFPCLFHLLRERFDIVLSSTFMDAFASQIARRFGGGRSLLMLNSIPPKKLYFRSLSLRGAVFGRAVRNADVVVSFSDYIREYLAARWKRESIILPPPVDTDRFLPKSESTSEPPVILCAAALEDTRKGGRPLMKAFDLLKRLRPDVRLELVTSVRPETKAALLALVSPEWRKDVEFSHAGDDLPNRFSKATISVLPSLWESYGMVVMESMAAGTPVVGTRHGALPELISNPSVGRLFDPGPDADIEPTNVSGLAEALDECIELARLPETSDRCRAHAMRFSWQTVGPRYEEAIRRLVDVVEQTDEAVRR
jgi:phosphatidylinositol alpha-mannosyltransferase